MSFEDFEISVWLQGINNRRNKFNFKLNFGANIFSILFDFHVLFAPRKIEFVNQN